MDCKLHVPVWSNSVKNHMHAVYLECQLMISMAQARVEAIKVRAVRHVLGGLGYPLFDILKDGLYYDYKIRLTDDSLFTLEELHIALQTLLGECSAEIMMRAIHFEIREVEAESLR